MGYILILGAKSDIAAALAHKYGSEGYDLYLAARNSHELKIEAEDLKIRYKTKVDIKEFNALDFDYHQDFYQNLEPKPSGVILVFGYLGEQKNAEREFSEAKKIIDTNFTGAVSILEVVASDFERKRNGFIIGISSVAGDRGRQSNYIYGSSKSAFSTYLSGLRNRLSKANITVMTVKPGFVYTKMTKDKKLSRILTGYPKQIAEDIFKAQVNKKDVLYTRWYWQFIMLIIRNIPEKIFKKMGL